MKALLVNGSPHKNGCTHTALDIVAGELREAGIEADEFWIGTKPIAGCIGCYKCGEQGECVFKDDKVTEFLAIAGDYDGYVFGAPVFYSGMAGSMKAFMDRVFFSNQGRVTFALKPAAVVTSARRAGTTATLEQLEKFLQHQQMIQVNSFYWPMVHGSKAEDVLRDEEGTQIMQVLGRNLAFTMKCIEAGRAAGVALPEPPDPRVWTNFVR
ncbi:MAG: flavodoxin family protein [Eggerthellaceae bacterium]|nr:flavodoxin family protein [Eggerthellaceae bacterium]